MTDDRIGEIWRLPENYCKPLAFGRAIEAECRGVPDYVWMIGTKGFMALFATEEAANDWQQMNGTNTPASYIQPVSIPVIAAAPKPEKAEPDCECGAVASEHCPACEPVAQEPELSRLSGALTAEFLEDAVIEPVRKKSGAWVPLYLHPQPVAQDPTAFLIEGFDGNGKRVAAVIQQNADNARNSASVFAEHYPSVKTSGLYLALQPDLTALREHDADVCQEFANFLGIEKREDVVKWIVAVRKGE